MTLQALLQDADTEHALGTESLELFLGTLAQLLALAALESSLSLRQLGVLIVQAALNDVHALDEALLEGLPACTVGSHGLLARRVVGVVILGQERRQVVHLRQFNRGVKTEV